MEDVKDIIEQLKLLDFNSNPYNDAKKLISSFGKFGFIELNLHATNEFIRARPLGEHESIKTIFDLSYKPKHLNSTYQRASTPNNSMFYAGLVQPEFTPDGFLAMGRMIGMMESVTLMRDKTSSGIQKIGFGKWTNTRDLHLAAIVYSEQFSKKNPKTEFLYDAFHKQIHEAGELYKKSLWVTEFLANEFAKDVIHHHFDYMISAIFTEIAIEKGFDGVIYPSVRTTGQGLNVAIHPDFVDKFMELRSAGECTIYKQKDHTIILNDTVALVPRGQIDLKLRPFDDPAKLDLEKQKVKDHLGLK